MRTELMNTSCGDLSIVDYPDQVKITVDNLALSKAPVSESDLVIIMSKVGPQYETTVASEQACDTAITYNTLEALLLSAEQCHNTFSLPSDIGTYAFASVRGGFRGIVVSSVAVVVVVTHVRVVFLVTLLTQVSRMPLLRFSPFPWQFIII